MGTGSERNNLSFPSDSYCRTYFTVVCISESVSSFDPKDLKYSGAQHPYQFLTHDRHLVNDW